MTSNKPIPQNWAISKLGDVCLSPQYGWTTKASDSGELYLLRTSDITSGSIDWDTVPYCAEEPPDVEKYLVHDGDIFISRAGSVGYSHLVKDPRRAVFASYLIRFKPIIDERYVAYFLQSPEYWQAISEQKLGIAIPNVNATKLRNIEIPVPPMSEQTRIVNKIEELLTQLDAGVVALERAQVNLKRYKASVLKSACEGRLVSTEAELAEAEDCDYEPASVLLERILAEKRRKWEEEEWEKLVEKAKKKVAQAWRKAANRQSRLSDLAIDEWQDVPEAKYAKYLPTDDRWKEKYEEPFKTRNEGMPVLPEAWTWATLDQLSVHVTSGSRGWAKYYVDAGSLFVRVGNFNRMDIELDLQDSVFVDPPFGSEADRTRLRLGDLLITITADVGMAAVVSEQVLQWNESYINQHVSLIRPVSMEISRYVADAINSEFVQEQISEKQYGVTKKGLGLEDIKSLIIPFPPLAEQERIVNHIESLTSLSDRLTATIEDEYSRAELLRRSILGSAFKGMLVPQDPDDEPAWILLERMHAEEGVS
jgi:type I restriction enzyme S subunit